MFIKTLNSNRQSLYMFMNYIYECLTTDYFLFIIASTVRSYGIHGCASVAVSLGCGVICDMMLLLLLRVFGNTLERIVDALDQKGTMLG
jgi:hypothetical protein